MGVQTLLTGNDLLNIHKYEDWKIQLMRSGLVLPGRNNSASGLIRPRVTLRDNLRK